MDGDDDLVNALGCALRRVEHELKVRGLGAAVVGEEPRHAAREVAARAVGHAGGVEEERRVLRKKERFFFCEECRGGVGVGVGVEGKEEGKGV